MPLRSTPIDAQEAAHRDVHSRLWSLTDRALVAIPPLVWLVFAWSRRWITDDGLIAARTVREILAGNGPVFNAGERVEANTSALWTWLVAAASWISRADVYKVMMYAGLALAPLGLLFALLGARKLYRRNAPGRRLIPLGALVVAALPPFWDFATSGLEESLIFCWLGLCWWLLCGVDPQPTTTTRRAFTTAFVLGFGWLVRPDMVLATVGFLIAFWFALRPSPRRATSLLLTAAALPLAYEVFRMGYYGLLVPNTALVKEASSTHFSAGIAYLDNYITPYHLWIPALLILIAALAAVRPRRPDQQDTRVPRRTQDIALVITVTCSAALMMLYVVAIGGDFMHARMLLPGTFLLLCPVAAVPLPHRTSVRTFAVTTLAATGVLVWAVLCATLWRLPQAPGVFSADGITNERTFWVERVGSANPIDAAPYVLTVLGRPDDRESLAWLLANANPTTQPILLLSTGSAGIRLPLNQHQQPARPIGVAGDILGTLGAQTPLDGLVVDIHGLSYALGSHLEPRTSGRVGHNKTVAPAWIVAQYTTSDAASALGLRQTDIAAARRAINCGDLRELLQATTAPMSWHRFWSNVLDSFTLTQLRVPNDPSQAANTLCSN